MRWALCLVALAVPASRVADAKGPVPAVFVGSSPCDGAIRPLLGIPGDADAELMEWTLTLHAGVPPSAAAAYELHVRYGRANQGSPGLARGARTLDRRGSWKASRGTRGDGDAVVYELDGVGRLLRLTENVLHLLNPDRSLMAGNGGWSYTLNRGEASEGRVDPSRDAAPDMSYALVPLATGPSVFGVFEGRSPCQGIARVLGIVVPAGCAKVKWRVTLFQDPATRDPTTYRVEGTLHRAGAREGRWTVGRGTDADPDHIVYRLAPTGAEATLALLRGDADVLFFLDSHGRPLTGNAEFSYTVNRRRAAGAQAQ